MERVSNSAVVAGTAAIVVVLFGSIGSGSAAAQRGATGAGPAAAADIPRTAWDKKPDLTGVWQGARLDAKAYGLAELEGLYRPEAKAQMKALAESDDPINHCMPYGYPRSVTTSYPFQIVQAVGVIVILNDRPHVYRHIPTDTKAHLDDIFPTYQGDSIAQWEGDTLVVDVTALNGKLWLAGANDRPTPGGSGGWITSDALHVVERWRLLDRNTLEYQATVEDPKVLTGPWTTPRIVLKRASVRKIAEGHCIPKGVDWESPALNPPAAK